MKILIVDDAKETRETLKDIINAKINGSYEIKEAQDGLEALLLIESFQPDIVLTDILMPNMDGIRFTSILKSQPETKHIFVAAITGLSGEEQIQKIYASGIDFYIAKPFQQDDIVARLKVITALVQHKKPTYEEKPDVVYNCFEDESIQHYFITFSIANEDDIFLVFDYFSHQNITYNSVLLKDFMVALIKVYRKMDKQNNKFNLIIEESESFIYLSVNNQSFTHEMSLLVKRENPLYEYAKNKDTFSFKIDIVSLLKETKKENRAEVANYQNELISASELMMISSEDLGEYIRELKDALDEYKSLYESCDIYGKSLRLVLINLFDQYTKLFIKVPEFSRISIALQSIAILIHAKEMHLFTKQKNERIVAHINALNNIIKTWIEDLIIYKNMKDVHYLDHDIMGLCMLIEEDFYLV